MALISNNCRNASLTFFCYLSCDMSKGIQSTENTHIIMSTALRCECMCVWIRSNAINSDILNFEENIFFNFLTTRGSIPSYVIKLRKVAHMMNKYCKITYYWIGSICNSKRSIEIFSGSDFFSFVPALVQHYPAIKLSILLYFRFAIKFY